MRNSRWHDPGRLIARQWGQSSMEYTVVVFFAVIVLVLPDANGEVALIKLANAFKHFYTGFAYAVSLSTTIMPM